MEMEKTSFTETVTGLAKRTGIEIKYEDGYKPQPGFKPDDTVPQLLELYDRTATMFSYFLLETEQGKEALKYALNRGLSREIIMVLETVTIFVLAMITLPVLKTIMKAAIAKVGSQSTMLGGDFHLPPY